MTEQRRKLAPCLLGTAAIALFAVLLMFRLDIPEKISRRQDPPLLLNNVSASEDIWLEIRQKGAKIGHVHRQKENSPEGRTFSEDIFMRINTLGVVQPITVKTSARFTPEGEIRGFTFSIASNLFPFSAEGTAQGGKMVVLIGKERKTIALPPKVYLSADAASGAALAGLAPGEKKTFSLFDPATFAVRPVTVEYLGQEALTVMGRTVSAKKLAFDFMGMRQAAWISPDGSVLREEGLLGMTLQRVSRQEALSGFEKAAAPDLAEAASIPVSTPIENPSAIRKLVMRLNGLPEGHFLLEGGRQTFKGGILTVLREDSFPGEGRELPENLHAFLEATPFIQSDHPSMIEKVSEIVAKEDSNQIKAEKLVAWVYKNIAKKPVISIPDALQTLKNRRGDCNEHAFLLAALARAGGLPARIETGLVFMRGSFFFHAWNVLYIDALGGWVTADAALGQFPADATHIRFARGELDHQIDLAGLIGRLKIDIVRMEP